MEDLDGQYLAVGLVLTICPRGDGQFSTVKLLGSTKVHFLKYREGKLHSKQSTTH